LKAVILAAGEGVRMRPLTSTRPKHMIFLSGKPILEHLLLSLKESGIKDMLIIVGYENEKIKQYFRNGSKLEIKLSYAVQKEALGTADAIQLAEDYVKKEPFLATYGDLLITPKAVKTILRNQKSKATTNVGIVPVDQPENYGIVKLNGNRILEIIEKPSSAKAPSKLANAGIYIFTSKIFDQIKKTGESPRKELEITDSIRSLVEDKIPVFATKIDSREWMDIGRPWDLLEANKRILQRTKLKIEGKVEDGAHLIGPVGLGAKARIRSGTYIEGPVFIDEASDIGPNCFIRPYTSIGKKVRIGNGCEVKNSIIMDGTHIGHLSYIGDSIIGARCNLGAGTITANLRLDEKPVKVMIKDKLADSGLRKLGVFVGDDVKTGINVNLMPGIKIGQGSLIGPGVSVHRDVPPNVLLIQKQELEQKPL